MLKFFLTTKQMYSIIQTQFGVMSSEYKLKIKGKLWMGEDLI